MFCSRNAGLIGRVRRPRLLYFHVEVPTDTEDYCDGDANEEVCEHIIVQVKGHHIQFLDDKPPGCCFAPI